MHIRRLSSPVVFLFSFFCFLCRSREKAFEIFAALPWPFYFFKLVFYPESAPSFKVISSYALLRQHSALKWIWIVVTECLRQFKRVSQRLGDLQLQQSRVVADLHWVDTFCRDGTLGSLMAWTCRTRWEQGAHLSAIMRWMTVKGEDKKGFWRSTLVWNRPASHSSHSIIIHIYSGKQYLHCGPYYPHF